MMERPFSPPKPAHYKAVIPVLAWIAAGFITLGNLLRVILIPAAPFSAIDLFFLLFFPSMVVPCVLLAIYFTLYRRKMGGNVLLGFGLGMLALSILGIIAEALFWGNMGVFVIPWLLEHVLFVMLLLSFISVCRGRTGKLFLILSACAGMLDILSSILFVGLAYNFIVILSSVNLFSDLGVLSLYLSLLLFGIHLPKAAPKEC